MAPRTSNDVSIGAAALCRTRKPSTDPKPCVHARVTQRVGVEPAVWSTKRPCRRRRLLDSPGSGAQRVYRARCPAAQLAPELLPSVPPTAAKTSSCAQLTASRPLTQASCASCQKDARPHIRLQSRCRSSGTRARACDHRLVARRLARRTVALEALLWLPLLWQPLLPLWQVARLGAAHAWPYRAARHACTRAPRAQ